MLEGPCSGTFYYRLRTVSEMCSCVDILSHGPQVASAMVVISGPIHTTLGAGNMRFLHRIGTCCPLLDMCNF